MQASRNQRDIRLDFFRGWALWFIYIDHIPSNFISNLTFRNFGFSDATEVFVFIAGHTAAAVYGARLDRQGFAYAAAHVWRRCWQLYVAHLILFVFFVAQVAYVAATFQNPMYVEELNISRFIENPHIALAQALILHFRPANLDILPLYIALLLVFPVVLWCLVRQPYAVLVASALLYSGVQAFKWTFPVYANGDTWFFNPLGWQFLFVIGALSALPPRGWERWTRWRPALGALAGVYLLFALFVVMSWDHPQLESLIPHWLNRAMYPIDKTNLDILRLVHVLAVVYLIAHYLPAQGGFARWRVWRPLVACGRHSLYVFCIGIYLSFAVHFLLVEFDDSAPAQLGLTLGGLVVMCLLAELMDWYQRAPGRSVAPSDKT